MGTKTKALAPRRKRMSRAARLQSGRKWLRRFSGKHVVASYARWFGVDKMCATKELQVLGVHFSAEYLAALRRTVGQRRRGQAARKGSTGVEVEPISNHEFAHIVGYTEGGAPFGVTWEETKSLDGNHGRFNGNDLGPTDCETPRPKRSR